MIRLPFINNLIFEDSCSCASGVDIHLRDEEGENKLRDQRRCTAEGMELGKNNTLADVATLLHSTH